MGEITVSITTLSKTIITKSEGEAVTYANFIRRSLLLNQEGHRLVAFRVMSVAGNNTEVAKYILSTLQGVNEDVLEISNILTNTEFVIDSKDMLCSQEYEFFKEGGSLTFVKTGSLRKGVVKEVKMEDTPLFSFSSDRVNLQLFFLNNGNMDKEEISQLLEENFIVPAGGSHMQNEIIFTGGAFNQIEQLVVNYEGKYVNLKLELKHGDAEEFYNSIMSSSIKNMGDAII